MSDGSRRRQGNLIIPRLLATLISLTVVGLGILAVLTQHYYGRTTKPAVAEISLDGSAAVAMGLTIAFIGLLPLAIWFPGRRSAIVWSVTCVFAAAVSFYWSVHAIRS